MDAITGDELQRDEQWSATPEDAAGAAVDARLKDLHTAMPGIVKSFNPATQTAQVQPAMQRLFLGVGWVDLPPCVDVPVQFPRGGGFVLTFPVAAGDECLLVFGERAIDFWWDRGGVQESSEQRFHDLSDAFAIMGVSSRPKMLSGFASDAAELRTLDGSTVLRIEAGTVYAGGKIGAQKALMAEAYRTQQTALNAAFSAFVAALAAWTPAGPASTVPVTAALNAAMTTLGSQLTTFEGASATYLATKAKVL